MDYYLCCRTENKKNCIIDAYINADDCGCGKNQESASLELAEEGSDLAYIQSKETLVTGITDFASMDYRDGGEWTGFDIELAETFAESMGVTLELKKSTGMTRLGFWKKEK